MLDVPAHSIQADIGVFGGSGFYDFLDDVEVVEIDTPYGPPSIPPRIGTIGDRRVAFIARHGDGHTIPAHMVNFRANVWAFAALGVRMVVGPFACGALHDRLDRGDVMIVDQQIDRTHGRQGTFFDGPETVHIPFAEPYDAAGGRVFAEVATEQGPTVHPTGTVLVIQGPRFSTKAESLWYRSMGADLVNMTQAPEAALCAEAGLPFVGIGLVTDHDAGVDGGEAVTMEDVFAVLEENAARVRKLLLTAVPRLPIEG